MKGRVFSFIEILIAFVWAIDAYGQASSTWALSVATTVTATNSGNVTGQDESFGNMNINNYTGPNNSQRVTINGGAWPAESGQDDNRFIQFAVSPNAGNDFNVMSLSLSLGASGGGNMKANIWYSTDPAFTTRTQLNGSTLSLLNGALSSLSYSPSVVVHDGQTLYVRIYPWYTTASSGKYVCPQDLVISGTASTAGAAITPSVGSLSSFAQTAGVPSSTQMYTVSGNGLTSGVVVTPPVGFEISTDAGSTWGDNVSPLILPVSGGIIVGQPVTITARLNASSGGPYAGDITHASTGVSAANVAVNGFTLAAQPTVQSSIGFGTVTGNSIVVNFSGGNGSKRIVVARQASAVSFLPTDGNAISGVSGNFTSATDQGGGNKVVFDGVGADVTVTGLSQNTTYHFAVFEYNVGIGNSQNYNTVSPGTGSQATLAVPTLLVTPSSLAFGGVEINTTSIERTYALSGTTLTPGSGNITVTAPSGYQVSTTSGSGFSSSISVPYSGGGLASTTMYAIFSPTAIVSYPGTISNTGGGAPTENVSVSGTGIGPAQQNVLEAEDGILNSAYVNSQYSGYSGIGYVDIANKTGASLDITFRRVSAATDTVRVYYALGASSRLYAVTLNDVAVGSPVFPSTGSWTTWSSIDILVPLQPGINRLKFAATTNTSENANLDRVYIGGQAATPVFKLLLTQSGTGSATAFPSSPDTYYDAGTEVTLTAFPSGGSMFYRWSGTDQSASNPFGITMNAHKTEIAVMPVSPGFGPFPYEAAPKGFASVGAFTYPNGTTGGSGTGSHTVYLTNSDDLGNLLLRRVDVGHAFNFPPLIVYIIGTLTPGSVVTDMCDVKDVYDISIIGVGVDATLSGFGLNVVRSKNIIVRNLKIQNAPIDGITVQADDVDGTGNHLWFDHNTITNCFDGALDVTHAASYVTISWNHFYNHSKLCLMGHSDNQASDVTMKVTYHHNYFDGTEQRHPRVRYGKAHVYNNYYRNIGLYGVSSNNEADVLVEGNHFLNVPLPTDTLRDSGSLGPGDVVERKNIFVNSGAPQTRGTAFEPAAYYGYSVEDPATLPSSLPSYSGSGKWDFSSSGSETPMPPGIPTLVAPSNGSIDVPLSPSLVWRVNFNTTGYRIQVSSDSTFTSSLIVDSTLADTSCGVSGLQHSTTYFWRVQATNVVGPGGFSLPWRFRTLHPPASGVQLSPQTLDFGTVAVGNSGLDTAKVISVGFVDLHLDSIRAQGGEFVATPSSPTIVPVGDSLLISISFSPTSVGAQGGHVILYSDAPTSPDSISLSGTGSSSTVLVDVPVLTGWNLISNPVTNAVPDDSAHHLFPTIMSRVFEFNTGYQAGDTMANGKGYWGKFPAAASSTITGTQRTSDSLFVVSGWNMVGTISNPVDTATITSVPPGLKVSNWFGWSESGYVVTTQLVPGKAYWVKSNGSGTFLLTTFPRAGGFDGGRSR